LCAIRKSQAENGADCQRNLLILGVVPVPDADVQVAVDPVEMDQVELFERRPIALLGTVDQPTHALGLALLLGGRYIAHSRAFTCPGLRER
jgi:hypothetical protein